MPNIVTIGYTVEGATDARFFRYIIRRTFEAIAFECPGEIEVYEPQLLERDRGAFDKGVIKAAEKASMIGLNTLCIHADADSASDADVFRDKITPAFASAEALEIEEICRILVAVVPVRMTESWLLADVDVLRSELETQLTPRDLGLHKPPESYADPKSAIEEALRLSQEKTPGRSRHTKLGISSLYQIIGQKADLSKLESLPSFRKFKAACRYAFKRLGYLY